MRNIIFSLIVIMVFFASPVFTQSWQIHINGNETYHAGNETLGYYPIFWYSSDDDRGVLVGGFGLGGSYSKQLSEKFDIRYQLNFQRSRYYDSPIIYRDEVGSLIGAVMGINTNYNISGFALPQIFLFKKIKLKAGIGLGFRAFVYSKSDYGETYIQGDLSSLKLKNNSRTPFLITIPIELNQTIKRWTLAIRAEGSVNSSSLLDLYNNEHSVMIFLEIGFKL